VVLDAEGDLPGVYASPREHWSKLRFHEPARSASTAKSVAAATSSASFPTTPRWSACPACCSPTRAMSGSSQNHSQPCWTWPRTHTGDQGDSCHQPALRDRSLTDDVSLRHERDWGSTRPGRRQVARRLHRGLDHVLQPAPPRLKYGRDSARRIIPAAPTRPGSIWRESRYPTPRFAVVLSGTFWRLLRSRGRQLRPAGDAFGRHGASLDVLMSRPFLIGRGEVPNLLTPLDFSLRWGA